MSIGVVDIGIGNIGSLRGALESQGWDLQLVTTGDDLKEIGHLLLPGVGAFGAAMKRLNSAGLIEPIRAYAASGRPLLGICLGMQLLAGRGVEGGETEGLGLILGSVLPLEGRTSRRLPHVGWNEMNRRRDHPLLDGIKAGVDFYFVHSYSFEPEDVNDILATTDYGIEYTSVVGRNNIIGVQFHPEKSQRNGLRLLDNFCLWDGTC